jgi:SAM-dependent methyltransferase
MTQPNTDPVKSGANLYEHQVSTDWERLEEDRLRLMDQFFAPVTEADLAPILSRVQTLATGEGRTPEVLDIGAGTGTKTEELCRQYGAGYSALDIHEEFLAARSTDPSRIIHASVEDIPMPSGHFDVTYNRAVDGWISKRDRPDGPLVHMPQKAIAEQLRVTRDGGIAVFTEFDWNDAGAEPGSPLYSTLMHTKWVMVNSLVAAGFNPFYGATMGSEIDEVVMREGSQYERVEIRHTTPEGDHIELFMRTAKTIMVQLEAAAALGGREASAISVPLSMLRANMSLIEQAPRGSLHIKLPTLVTNIVVKK